MGSNKGQKSRDTLPLSNLHPGHKTLKRSSSFCDKQIKSVYDFRCKIPSALADSGLRRGSVLMVVFCYERAFLAELGLRQLFNVATSDNVLSFL